MSVLGLLIELQEFKVNVSTEKDTQLWYLWRKKNLRTFFDDEYFTY